MEEGAHVACMAMPAEGHSMGTMPMRDGLMAGAMVVGVCSQNSSFALLVQ